VTVRSASPVPGARPPGWGLFAASWTFGLIVMHTTEVNVALPAIARGLGAGIASLQWCVSAYALLFASLLLPFGALADRLGARRVLLLGLAIFACSGTLSAAAPAIWVVMAGQAVAGIGAAMIAPASLSIVREIYPVASERTRAVGLLSLGLSAGFGAGPVLGGLMVGLLSWRAVFLVDAPLAAIGALLALRFVAPSPARPARAPRAGGVISAVLALGSLTYAIIASASHGSAAGIGLALAAMCGGLAGFVYTQRRSSAPLIPARVAHSREIPTVAAIGLVFNLTVYGQLFLMSLAIQRDLHASALRAGLMFLAQPAGTLMVAAAVGRWLSRAGPRLPLIAGMTLIVTSAIMLRAFDAAPRPLVVELGLLCAGIGGGLVVPSLHTTVVVVSPPDLVGIASASLNASRQIGAVLGVAVLGAFAHARALDAGVRLALLVGAGIALVGLGVVVGLVRPGLVRAGPALEPEPNSRRGAAAASLAERNRMRP
jgi:DHA2 family methylenomycin A resistance protein-like MFS transporter